MTKVQPYFLHELAEAIGAFRSPEQIEIRPMLDGTGRWIQILRRRGHLALRLDSSRAVKGGMSTKTTIYLPDELRTSGPPPLCRAAER